MKKLIALFLIFSIIGLYGNLYAKERRGADLVITKTSSQQVEGELIVVKEDSLLLMEKESGGDVTVDIVKIREIKILRSSKALFGAIGGFFLGGLMTSGVTESSGFGPNLYPVLYGLLGAVVGGFTAAVASQDKIIQIEGKSYLEVKKILEELRKKARVPDFQ